MTKLEKKIISILVPLSANAHKSEITDDQRMDDIENATQKIITLIKDLLPCPVTLPTATYYRENAEGWNAYFAEILRRIEEE